MISAIEKVSVGYVTPNGKVYGIYVTNGAFAGNVLLKYYSVVSRIGRLMKLGNLKHIGNDLDNSISYINDLNQDIETHKLRLFNSLDSFLRWSLQENCHRGYFYIYNNWNYANIDIKDKNYNFVGKIINTTYGETSKKEVKSSLLLPLSDQSRFLEITKKFQGGRYSAFHYEDMPGSGLATDFWWFSEPDLSLKKIFVGNNKEIVNNSTKGLEVSYLQHIQKHENDPIVVVKEILKENEYTYCIWDGAKRIHYALATGKKTINAIIGIRRKNK